MGQISNIMNDFYLYLNSQDSFDIRKNNDPSEFLIQLPKSYTLEGSWTCAVTEVSLTCDFKPRSQRLYLCGDFVQESYVRDSLLPVLRNFEIETRYKKLKHKEFVNLVRVPLTVTHLNSLRLYLKDEHLKPVQFNSKDLHCVLHFKKSWAR